MCQICIGSGHLGCAHCRGQWWGGALVDWTDAACEFRQEASSLTECNNAYRIARHVDIENARVWMHLEMKREIYFFISCCEVATPVFSLYVHLFLDISISRFPVSFLYSLYRIHLSLSCFSLVFRWWNIHSSISWLLIRSCNLQPLVFLKNFIAANCILRCSIVVSPHVSFLYVRTERYKVTLQSVR